VKAGAVEILVEGAVETPVERLIERLIEWRSETAQVVDLTSAPVCKILQISSAISSAARA